MNAIVEHFTFRILCSCNRVFDGQSDDEKIDCPKCKKKYEVSMLVSQA